MTRDEQMEAVLEVVRARWAAEPAQRLGQLLVNAALIAHPSHESMPALFYLEDDDLVAALRGTGGLAAPSPGPPDQE